MEDYETTGGMRPPHKAHQRGRQDEDLFEKISGLGVACSACHRRRTIQHGEYLSNATKCSLDLDASSLGQVFPVASSGLLSTILHKNLGEFPFSKRNLTRSHPSTPKKPLGRISGVYTSGARERRNEGSARVA